MIISNREIDLLARWRALQHTTGERRLAIYRERGDPDTDPAIAALNAEWDTLRAEVEAAGIVIMPPEGNAARIRGIAHDLDPDMLAALLADAEEADATRAALIDRYRAQFDEQPIGRGRITNDGLRRVLDLHAGGGVPAIMAGLGYSERNARRLLARARRELPEYVPSSCGEAS